MVGVHYNVPVNQGRDDMKEEVGKAMGLGPGSGGLRAPQGSSLRQGGLGAFDSGKGRP